MKATTAPSDGTFSVDSLSRPLAVPSVRGIFRSALWRGDLPLLLLAFDLLWEDELSRQWLKWKVPMFCLEQAWYLFPRLPRPDDAWRRPDWWGFIRLLACAPRSPDCVALAKIESGDGVILPSSFQVEADLVFSLRARLPGADFSVVVPSFIRAMDSLTEEKKKKIKVNQAVSFDIQDRLCSGGTVSDGVLCAVALILLRTRGLSSKRLSAIEAEFTSLEPVVPAQVVPWWVVDPDNSLLREATILYTKQAGLPSSEVDRLLYAYRFFAFGEIPVEMLQLAPKIKERELVTIWWLPYMRSVLGRGGKDPREAVVLWRKARKQVKELLFQLINEQGGMDAKEKRGKRQGKEKTAGEKGQTKTRRRG